MSDRPVDRAPESPWKASYFWMRNQRDEALALAEAAEARVVLLEAQRDEAVEELRNAKASLASGPLREGYAYMVIGRVIDALAAVSVADSGPEEKKP